MIEALLVAVAAIVVISVVTALSPRVGVPGPLILVVIGVAVSLLPFMPAVSIDPEIILVGVLPPLLYSAAVSLPAIEFRRDFGPIAGLSVVLVVLSALALGAFFFFLIPGLGLPLAIALGAILSPTDAVATSIAKRLGIAPRVVTMLEGESLLNDATSLVILRTATAAAIAGSPSIGGVLGSFVWSIFIAVVVGALIGWVNLRVRARLNHATSNTALSFVVPFVAYIPTEHLGGSGLVAAVVAGVITGQGAARWFTPDQRRSDEMNWRTIELILEGAVFLVMGLEVKDLVLHSAESEQGLGHPFALAAGALLIVLVVRTGYVSFLVWMQSRRAQDKKRQRVQSMSDHVDRIAATPRPPTGDPRIDRWHDGRRLESIRHRISRSLADLDYYQASPLGWRHGTVIVWAGMRGVVTLAAAQTLPEDTAERSLLVFVAFLVATGSLLLQGSTLARLVRMLGLAGSGGSGPRPEERRELDAELREAASETLRARPLNKSDGTPFDDAVLAEVDRRFAQPVEDDAPVAAAELHELRMVALQAMRDRLDELSHGGRFSTAALRHALASLDADQISLELRMTEDEE